MFLPPSGCTPCRSPIPHLWPTTSVNTNMNVAVPSYNAQVCVVSPWCRIEALSHGPRSFVQLIQDGDAE